MKALRAVLQRVIKLTIVILIISFLTFILTKLLPGDPVNTILGPQASDPAARAAVTRDLGLDKPFFTQYFDWLGGVVFHFDFGRAYSSGFQVKDLIANRLPVTIELMVLAQAISLIISVPLAVWSAYRANHTSDKIITTTSFGLISFPNYALAVFLVYLFAVQWQFFPAVGYTRLTADIGEQPPIGRAVGHGAGRRSHRGLHPAPAQRHDRHVAGGLHPHGPRQGPAHMARPDPPRPATVVVLAPHGVRHQLRHAHRRLRDPRVLLLAPRHRLAWRWSPSSSATTSPCRAWCW